MLKPVKMGLCMGVLCAMLALCGAAGAQETAFYEEMPPFLRVVQNTQTETVRDNVYIRRTYPRTANPEIDAQLCGLVDEMVEKNREKLPGASASVPSYLEVGPVITRTGTSWMSFLTLAEVSGGQEQLSVDFDARVMDMETGERITLEDVFPPDSEAWALLAQAVREQLSAAFPGEALDEQALSALCAEQLRSAPFTLGAERLTLTYRADAVYPGRQTLLHVHLYYPQIRPLMTERARQQTDNSRFRMVALTYDDGGGRIYTRNLLDALRMYAAKATFFVVGTQIGRNHDTLCRQQDGGYSIQSHTYTHAYPGSFTVQQAFEDKERFSVELSAVIGVTPTMMRSPGGMDQFYVENEIGYPLIHWSLASGDSGNNDGVERITNRVLWGVGDGDIVLMHDINPNCANYTKRILEALSGQGYLFVTVEELFAREGVVPQANHVYMRPDWEQTE